jgi:hypothetical protein
MALETSLRSRSRHILHWRPTHLAPRTNIPSLGCWLHLGLTYPSHLHSGPGNSHLLGPGSRWKLGLGLGLGLSRACRSGGRVWLYTFLYLLSLPEKNLRRRGREWIAVMAEVTRKENQLGVGGCWAQMHISVRRLRWNLRSHLAFAYPIVRTEMNVSWDRFMNSVGIDPGPSCQKEKKLTCIYLYLHICLYLYLYLYIYTYVYTYVYISISIHLYVYIIYIYLISIYIRMYMCIMCIYMCVCVFIYLHVCSYILTFIY